MSKAIGDYSFYKKLFIEGEIGRENAISELQIVHEYNYEILLPISVLYCVVGTRFKRNPRNPQIYRYFQKVYGLRLVDSESTWSRNINNLFQHNYANIATPTLADMEVRNIIHNDPEIKFLLTYQKEKYIDLFQQVQTF